MSDLDEERILQERCINRILAATNLFLKDLGDKVVDFAFENEPSNESESNKRPFSRTLNGFIIGAGIGEYVLVAQGSAARVGCDMADAPVDAAIVGIVDEGQEWNQ